MTGNDGNGVEDFGAEVQHLIPAGIAGRPGKWF